MRLGGLQECSLIDYPGHICAIVFTIGCNFRCPYCHNPELVDETAEEISEEDFFKFLKKRKGRLDAVTITGGEPTMHDDLILFIKKIKELGFKVKLDSNGTKPSIIKQVQDEKLVDYIAMDIKAPLAKYEATIARPVDIKAMRESMDLLMSGDVPYEFRTTVIKSLLPPEDLEQIGKEIAGANNYYLQKFVSSKLLNPGFVRKTTYSDEEFEEFREMMLKYVENCEIR